MFSFFIFNKVMLTKRIWNVENSSISSLFTAHCYANEVSRHTNPSNFGMMKVNRGHNSGNKLEATSVTKKASCY